MALPTSLSEALDFECSGSECTLQLPKDISIGDVSVGGFVACFMSKHAVLYASQHPRMGNQKDIRSAIVQFYRPILFGKPVVSKLREVVVGKAWSSLRVEVYQGDRIGASADLTLTDFAMPGISIKTHWQLTPPPTSADLSRLELDEDDSQWVSYQLAFHKDGFRRGNSYLRYYVPKKLPSAVSHVEQWVTPGWDCEPQGSRAAVEKARWTNDMIHFVLDSSLPVQENLVTAEPGRPLPMGSLAAILEFSNAQKQARKLGRPDWRVLDLDGSKTMMNQTVHVTLVMSTEIKKRLPAEGVRFLYMRAEAKAIPNSRLDTTVLLFDETLDLVAICHQVLQIIPASQKMANKMIAKTAKI